MRFTRVGPWLTLAIVAILATPAVAQQRALPQTRQGFWLSFGFGIGATNVDCPLCADERKSGLTGSIAAGDAVSRALLLGVELDGWIKNDVNAERTIVAGFATATLYPIVHRGLFIKAGAGLMRAKVTSVLGSELSGTGFAGQVGLGYDLRTSRTVSMTPFLSYMMSLDADLEFNGGRTGGSLNADMLQLGVGLTWH